MNTRERRGVGRRPLGAKHCMTDVCITHVGGPTTLIQIGSWSLLTDPTFDPPACDAPLGGTEPHDVASDCTRYSQRCTASIGSPTEPLSTANRRSRDRRVITGEESRRLSCLQPLTHVNGEVRVVRLATYR